MVPSISFSGRECRHADKIFAFPARTEFSVTTPKVGCARRPCCTPLRCGCGWRIVISPIIRRNFRILLRFCDVRSGRPFDPFHRYPGSSARTWRCPFPRCRVASAQASTPDPESLPATSAESVRVGPDLCSLAGALAASHSPASICHCAEALDPARPSPSHVQEKVPHAVLPQSPSQARPEGTECRTHPCGCGNEATEPPLGLSANCGTDRLGLQPSD